MTYQLKKDHLTNWDVPKYTEKSTDGQADSNSHMPTSPPIGWPRSPSPLPTSNNKPLRTPSPPLSPTPPTTSSNTDKRKRQPHTLLYAYNQPPENGIPLATQYKNERKEKEKEKRKPIRKVPPGEGSLAPLPEIKPPEMNKNYYPYWHYYKATNPDWDLRHRQTRDGRLLPYDTVDPSKYAPTLDTTNVESAQPMDRNSRQPDHHNETFPKESLSVSHESPKKKKSSTTQHTPSSNTRPSNRDSQPNGSRHLQQRHMHPINNDVNSHPNRPATFSSPQDTNDSIINSDIFSNESKDPRNSKTENKKHRHHHHRHHHHHHHHHHHKNRDQLLPEQQKSVAEPKTPHHHHHRPHIYEYPEPSTQYIDSEFRVVDASFKKSQRTPYFQGMENRLNASPPVIYNQESFLPPVTRNEVTRPNVADHYPTAVLDRNWRESLKSPRIYKPDVKMDFYDRYFNRVIERKLTPR